MEGAASSGSMNSLESLMVSPGAIAVFVLGAMVAIARLLGTDLNQLIEMAMRG